MLQQRMRLRTRVYNIVLLCLYGHTNVEMTDLALSKKLWEILGIIGF